MKDEYEKHKRRSIHLKNFDYSSSNAYFVTICAFQKENVFGDVADGEMSLNDNG